MATGADRNESRNGTWRHVSGYSSDELRLYTSIIRIGGEAVYRLLAARSASGLVRFSIVCPRRLTRSGLPTAVGWRELRRLGIRAIVNLCMDDDDVDLLNNLGFQSYLHLPVPDGLPPSPDQTEAFLEFVAEPANWPVHLHCLTGVQRSGIAVALVRYAVEGLSLQAALHEANGHFPGPTRRQAVWLRRWVRDHKPRDHPWLSQGQMANASRPENVV